MSADQAQQVLPAGTFLLILAGTAVVSYYGANLFIRWTDGQKQLTRGMKADIRARVAHLQDMADDRLDTMPDFDDPGWDRLMAAINEPEAWHPEFLEPGEARMSVREGIDLREWEQQR